MLGPTKKRKFMKKTTPRFLDRLRNTRFRKMTKAIVVILSPKYGFVLASCRNLEMATRR